MYFKGYILSVIAMFALVGCDQLNIFGPETDDDADIESVIEINSSVANPIESSGVVSVDLSNHISMTDDVSPLYSWYFDGDENPVVTTNPVSSYTYSDNGEYQVSVLISDQNNNAATKVISFVVEITSFDDDIDPVPVYEIRAPEAMAIYSDMAGLAVFDITNEIVISDNVSASFVWNFGDGSSEVTTSQALTEHVYESEGSFDATLDIIDTNSNAISVSVQITVTVNFYDKGNALIPVIIVTQRDGLSLTFDGSHSANSDAGTLSYSWDFGDDNIENGSSIVTHEYQTEGTYIVTLTVSDGAITAAMSISVTVIDPLIDRVLLGESLYDLHCASCHEGDDSNIYGEGNDQYDPININRFLDGYADLHSLIETTMPEEDPQLCINQCALDITEFMHSWPPRTYEISCSDPENEEKFGARSLKLLTQSEYINSVKDVLGVDVDPENLMGDTQVYNFSNQLLTEVDFSRFKAYQLVAVSIVDQLAVDDFASFEGMQSCVAREDCADRFVGEVLTPLFRRAITATEIEQYQALFNVQFVTKDKPKEGLILALRTALMSPNFLYRHELGMTPSEYELYNLSLNDMPQWEFDRYSGWDFSQGYVNGPSIQDDILDAYQSAYLNYNFTGNDLIEFDLFANTDGQDVTIAVGNTVIWSGSTDEMTTLELSYDGVEGVQTFVITAGSLDIEIDELRIGRQPYTVLPLAVPDVEQDVYVLTPAEIASYLSYNYTGTTPDEILLEAAFANELSSTVQIQTQIERLLETDAAKEQFGEFAASWFYTDDVLYATKDNTVYPNYTDEVKQAMAQEAREIFTGVMFDDTAPFSEIYDSNYTFLNQTLAQFYGVPGVSGDEFIKTVTPERGGIITSGAFLSVRTSPVESKIILRAVQIRERFMCQHFPPLPSNVDLGAIREQQQALVDETKEQHAGIIRQPHLDFINTSAPECQICHEYMIDSLGLGLEDFDAVGLPRTQYNNGLSVDFTGFDSANETHHSALYGISNIYYRDDKVLFQGAKELGEIFATGAASDVAKSCFVEMGFRYMSGTGTEVYDFDDPSKYELTHAQKLSNACAADQMSEVLEQSQSPKDVFIQMGISDIVRFRKEFN